MTLKTCLITGANSGIGKAAAIQIAQKGYRVLLGCRNHSRGLSALDEIKNESGSEAIELVIIDLASQASIKDAASQINTRYPCLDVLIHNAADFDITRKKPVYSPENIETVWATNHIGPVFLTQLLLELMKQSEQGRILTVASQGLVMHPKLTINLEDPEFKKGGFSVDKAYYQSKLAQVMYTYWLAEQLKDIQITVNCIRVTNVKIDLERYPNLSGWMKFLYSIKSKFSISPEKMAETYNYLATAGELRKTTGKYFDEKNNEVDSSAYSHDPEQIEALMRVTQAFIR